jgi:hypothetical protein
MTTARTAAPPRPVVDLDEEDRLSALEDLHVLDTEPEERFDRITRLARRLFDVDVALVTLLDRDRQWFKAVSGDGIDVPEIPRTLSFCDTTIRHDGSLVVEDLSTDERFRSNPLVTADTGVRFYAGYPLHAPGGQPVGTLCLLDHAPRPSATPSRRRCGPGRLRAAGAARARGVRAGRPGAARATARGRSRRCAATRSPAPAGRARRGRRLLRLAPVSDGIGFTVATSWARASRAPS